MEYTLGFIFTNDLNKVLMLYRNKDPYISKFNGLGGKVNYNEIAHFAFKREIKEEVGIDLDKEAIHTTYLMTIYYPSNNSLHVFYSVLKKDFDILKLTYITNEGVLSWFNTNLLLDVTEISLAGEGNIPYFINYALMLERREV